MWRVQVMWLRAWEMDGMPGGTGQNQPKVETVESTARKKGELEGGGMAHNLAMQPHSSSRHRQRGAGVKGGRPQPRGASGGQGHTSGRGW